MKIGFIGAGNMALALAQGLVRAGKATPEELTAHARSEASRTRFASAFSKGSPVWAKNNADVCRENSLIVLAVKPQQLAAVLEEVRETSVNKLFLSVAAGRTITFIGDRLHPEARVVRSMPNTPALIGFGASAYAGGHTVTEEDYMQVQEILGAVGHAVRVEEKQLDAVTALSGSGPAYFFEIMEAFIEAGVEQGLPVGLSRTLVVQTCLGAAKMAELSGEEPSALADRVKSPGGTTVAGCQVLEEEGMHEILMRAVDAARARAQELGAAAEETKPAVQ